LIATDNCSGGFTVSYQITGETNRPGTGTDASGYFAVGISVINWEVTDACGNIYNCTTEVEVIMPEVICPDPFGVCIDADLQLLSGTGEDPEGGVFSGPGVTIVGGNYYFNPGSVNAGDHPIDYTWTNPAGYSATCTFNITVYALPEFTASVNQDPLCYNSSDGIIDITFTNGTPMFNVDWGTGSAFANAMNYSIVSLSAADYTIIVTDANGCEYQSNTTLINPDELTAVTAVTSDYNGQDISCNSASDGSAIVNATGGTGIYTYIWSASAAFQATQEATGLHAGTHTVTVEDANGCTFETSVVLTEPDPLIVDVTVNNDVTCYGLTDGNATAAADGGTPFYTYTWNDPLNSVGPNASQLPSGTWVVNVTDINGCTGAETVDIDEPTEINITFTNIQNITCFGDTDGRLGVIVSGGTPQYDYLWDDDDASEYPLLINIPADTYSITVTDENGCTVTDSYEITQPDPLVLQVNTQPVICGSSLGSALVNVQGGVTPYDYLWSNGNTSPFVSGLEAGEYIINVTDDHGCESQSTANVYLQGNINVNIVEQIPVSCYGESDATLMASISNGVPEYEFEWSDESTQQMNVGLGAGQYSVFVTDSWGCQGQATYLLTEPEDIYLSFSTQDVTCYDGDDGEATVSASGGSAPYSAHWVDGPYMFTYSGLSSGTYEVIVTDARGCTKNGEAVINQPENPLALITDVHDISCSGLTDGYINVQATGGTPDYYYSWVAGEYTSNQSSIAGLAEGFYYLTVVDGNNCTVNSTFILSQPAPIEVSYSTMNPSCIGNTDGEIELIVLGGTQPYYVYYNGYTSPITYITGLAEGHYYVEVIDDRGCAYTVGNLVLEDTPIDCIQVPNAFTPNGDGVNDTFIIQNIHLFPDALIKIYNRWGQFLWQGNYDEEWDGMYNGKFVPTGTYIYVIELFGRENPRVGTVTVIY